MKHKLLVRNDLILPCENFTFAMIADAKSPPAQPKPTAFIAGKAISAAGLFREATPNHNQKSSRIVTPLHTIIPVLLCKQQAKIKGIANSSAMVIHSSFIANIELPPKYL